MFEAFLHLLSTMYTRCSQCAVIMGKDGKAGGKGKGKQAAGGSDESSGKGKGKGGKAADGLGTCTYVKGLF